MDATADTALAIDAYEALGVDDLTDEISSERDDERAGDWAKVETCESALEPAPSE